MPQLKALLSKLSTEFIGTLVIVFVYAVAGTPGPGNWAAIGATVTAMVYAGGHLTGGLYNPAVTVAVAIRGKNPRFRLPISNSDQDFGVRYGNEM